MSDKPQRRSALAGVLEAGTYGRKLEGGPGVILRERPNLSITQVAAYGPTAEDAGTNEGTLGLTNCVERSNVTPCP